MPSHLRTSSLAPPSEYSQQDFQNQIANHRQITCSTVYGLAWSPSTSPGEAATAAADPVQENGAGRYLVACTSRGTLCFWDIWLEQQLWTQGSPQEEHEIYQEEEKILKERNKKRRRRRPIRWWWQEDSSSGVQKDTPEAEAIESEDEDLVDSKSKMGKCGKIKRKRRGEPIFSFSVKHNTSNNKACVGPLYDVHFSYMKGITFLITSGTDGVYLYKWSDFLPFLTKQQPAQTKNTIQESIQPLHTFHPHPTPTLALPKNKNNRLKHSNSYNLVATEVNSISCDPSRNILYGAAGDGFGCYRWDVSTGALLGTMTGHEDYLHVVKAACADDLSVNGTDENASPARVILTGGEDGKLGVWDPKDGQLIDILPCRTSSQSQAHNKHSLHVSSIDVDQNANWMVVGGGTAASASSSSSKPSSMGGFVSIWNLGTRTLTYAASTKECVQCVAYYQAPEVVQARQDEKAQGIKYAAACEYSYHQDRILSVGNESIVSFWSTATAAKASSCLPALTRQERVWSNPPSSYAISVCRGNGMVAIGGAGHVVDCYVDVGSRAFGLLVL